LVEQTVHTQDHTGQAPDRAGNSVLYVFLLVALGFGVAAFNEHAKSQMTLRMAAQGRYNASPEEVLGKHPVFRSAGSAPYTLVEFGDYECPPCRHANPQVLALLARHPREINYVFRDLPLTNIHPLAMRAALIADEAGSPSAYWRIHDKLYKGSMLDEPTLLQAQEALSSSVPPPVPERLAQDSIQEAQDEAASLGIRATPTFVLVCPHGVVRRVSSLDQISSLIATGAAH
jgi:protein-disulfide isomerase